jgi:hypothetical protein
MAEFGSDLRHALGSGRMEGLEIGMSVQALIEFKQSAGRARAVP